MFRLTRSGVRSSGNPAIALKIDFEMLFNSLQFFVFLAVVLFLYHGPFRGRPNGRHGLLLLASWFFYACWNPAFLLLLIFSTILDHRVALGLTATEDGRWRKFLLALSLFGNLGVLAFFKYGAFFSKSIAALLPWEVAPPDFFDQIILPVGISFYTFQSLSYSIDVYRGTLPAERSFLRVALYVSFFPQLVAGPIVRATQFLPQLATSSRLTTAQVEDYSLRIVSGLVKKVCIADILSRWVDVVFSSSGDLGSWDLLLGVYAFCFQIYFDFSAYSDIAIGVAGLFGFRLPENFNRPYLARNPQEFWRRWHISLSTWLRDYLYISLGGNRRGAWRTERNLLITMVLGGLWHGAGIGFIVWGLFHGVVLILHRWVAGLGGLARVPDWLKTFTTFQLVCIGWVFFRAPTLEAAREIFAGILRFDGSLSSEAWPFLFGVIFCVILHLIPSSDKIRARICRLPAPLSGALMAFGVLLVFVCSSGSREFIYFQF